MSRQVHIGTPSAGGLVVGAVRVPVIAGVAGGADAVRVGAGACQKPDLDTIRRHAPTPLFVEAGDQRQYDVAVSHADAVVVPARFAPGERAMEIPDVAVAVRREATTGIDDWLAAARAWASRGCEVMLCEGGAPGGGDVEDVPRLDLLQAARDRTDHPVLVDVAAAPELCASAVVAGADGVMLPTDASEQDGATTMELATTLCVFGHVAEPGTVAEARQAIDMVDASVASLLERRAELAGTVQRLKPVGGFAGRDPRREEEVVAAVASRAPRLGIARVRKIMRTVIEAGLDLAEEHPADPSRKSAPPRSHGLTGGGHSEPEWFRVAR